jgi:putative aldouronate transport system permease protein
MIIIALACLLPFLLVVSSSFMHEKDLFISGYTYFPKMGFTTAAYQTIFAKPMQLLQAYWITISSTVVGTAAGVILTISTGYPLTRQDYRWKKPISFYLFFTMIFNGGLVPGYIMTVGWLHLANTFMVIALQGWCSAYFVLIAKGMMSSIPSSVIESAKIDGASEFRTYLRIVLPISKPAIATVGLFLAIGHWNDWQTCFLYIDNKKLYTLPYLLVQVQQNIAMYLQQTLYGGSKFDPNVPMYTTRMALSVLSALPIICVYPFIQKYFEKGIMIGSIKG